MTVVFYIAAAVAIIATFLTITRLRAVHALIYLVVSLLAVAVVFYTLGAPFVAALEVIIYAGAIMVLFIFVMMTLNIGDRAIATERAWLQPKTWTGPAILAAILLGEFVYTMVAGTGSAEGGRVLMVGPTRVSAVLFGPWLLGVELASMLLLAGIVAAYRLGNPRPSEPVRFEAVRRPDLVNAGKESNGDGFGSAEPGVMAGGHPVHAGTGRRGDAP